MDVHIAFFHLSFWVKNEYNGRYTDPSSFSSVKESGVTSTYFVLIGCSHRELGRLVLKTRSHCTNWTELNWRSQLRTRSVQFSSWDVNVPLVHAFVTSRVEYCNAVLAWPPNSITKLRRVLNVAFLIVNDTRNYDCHLSTYYTLNCTSWTNANAVQTPHNGSSVSAAQSSALNDGMLHPDLRHCPAASAVCQLPPAGRTASPAFGVWPSGLLCGCMDDGWTFWNSLQSVFKIQHVPFTVCDAICKRLLAD